VCNSSNKQNTDELQTEESQDKKLGQSNNQPIQSSNTSKTSKSADTGPTGMIVYESPNMKNRIYAIIGLIMVGLTCIGAISYKIYTLKKEKVVEE